MPKASYDKVKQRISNRKSYLKHRQERLLKAKKYHWLNKEKRNKYNREYSRNRWANDPEWRERNKQRLRDLYRKQIAWYKVREKNNSKSFEQKARQKFNYAIRIGKIIRPKNCDACSKRCSVEGHHYKGYKFPYKVIWLCRICHAKVHRKY